MIILEIGTRIKELRISKGLKVIELAQKAHISQPYLSDIERGRTTPSLDTLASICEALDITLGEFFGYSPDMPPDLRRLLETARDLTPEQRAALQRFLETMLT